MSGFATPDFTIYEPAPPPRPWQYGHRAMRAVRVATVTARTDWTAAREWADDLAESTAREDR